MKVIQTEQSTTPPHYDDPHHLSHIFTEPDTGVIPISGPIV